MDEISQENQEVLGQEQAVVEETKVRKTKETSVTKDTVSVEGAMNEKSDPAENNAPTEMSVSKTKASTGAVIKENNANKNNHRRGQNQAKNNFKAPQNKFIQAPSASACPATLQRYRWWMGQLYQWRNISDMNSLNNLVNEVTDESLPAFYLNEWYEKRLQE